MSAGKKKKKKKDTKNCYGQLHGRHTIIQSGQMFEKLYFFLKREANNEMTKIFTYTWKYNIPVPSFGLV